MNIDQCRSLILQRINEINGRTVRNPRTGHTINVDGRAFQNLLRECSSLGDETINTLIEQYIEAYQNQNQRRPVGYTTWRRQIETARANRHRPQVQGRHGNVNFSFSEFRLLLPFVSERNVRIYSQQNRLSEQQQRELSREWMAIHQPPPAPPAPPAEPPIRPRQINDNSPQARSLVSSASPTNDMEILLSCSIAFSGINETPFKGLGNKLLKGCSKLDAEKHCQKNTMQTISRDLKEKYLTSELRLRITSNHNDEFRHLFTHYDRQSFSHDVLFSTPIRLHPVKYVGEPGVGPGISQNYFQNLLNQIFTKKFFVPTEEGSERCLINPDVDVTEFFPRMSYRTPRNNMENRKKVFKFIGSVLAYSIINDIKSDLHLSRSIQARFLYKTTELTAEDYILYYLLEFSEERPTYINLLKNPEHIEMAGLEFNEPIVLDPSRNTETLKSSNFRQYLELLSKEKLKVHESEPYLSAMLEGFFITRRFLRNRGVNLPQIDALMTGSQLTAVEIEEIIAKIVSTGIQQTNKITWFFNILRDDGTNASPAKFPINVAREEPLTRPQTLEEFKKQLLFFWTGSRTYNSNFNYRVVHSSSNVIQSHTCYYQLDIPSDIRSQKAMYEMLVRIVGLEGFGFA
jgi:hypothetical protein